MTSASEAKTSSRKVFLDYDQAALDAAYDQAAYAPNRLHIFERYEAASDEARAQLGQPLRSAYGTEKVEQLDIYRAKTPNAPIQVFIHGGAWRSGSAKENAFAAELFCRAGAHFVVPDFSWVQDVGGDLVVLADQLRRAVAWIYNRASEFGGDPKRLYICGHSSGAHLAAVLLTTDWQAAGLPLDIVKGGTCISGMYDLKPVLLSARGAYVKVDAAAEDALSPQRNLARLVAPIIVASGSLETPEFQRQARDFSAALAAAKKPVTVIHTKSYNHFEMAETLTNPYGVMGRAVLQQMGLAPPTQT